MTILKILNIFLLFCAVTYHKPQMECSALYWDKKCAIIYSNDNYEGDTFVLTDFDQSSNLKRDYRTSLEGWWQSGSFQVETNCTVYLCSETYYQGDCKSFTAGSYQSDKIEFPILSSNCTCANVTTSFERRPYPVQISLPDSADDLLNLRSSNATLSNHPGIVAALKSHANGKSGKNVYILVIGTGKPVSIGLENCYSYFNQFSECHLSVNTSELGVLNTQLRLIFASMTHKYQDTKNDDGRWLASLEDFLSNHVELNGVIPNVVIMYHWLVHETDISDNESRLQRKMAALNLLRGRILAEDYTNVIHVLSFEADTNRNITLEDLKNPLKTIARLEKEMTKEAWSFPKPTIFVPRKYKQSGQEIINGYYKLDNGEYFPRNLQQNLMLISKNGGDALGYEIFKAAFPEKLAKVGEQRTQLLPSNHIKVLEYKSLYKLPPLVKLSSAELERLKMKNSFHIHKSEKILESLDKKFVELEKRMENQYKNQLQDLQDIVKRQNIQITELKEKVLEDRKFSETLETEISQLKSQLTELQLKRENDMEKIKEVILTQVKNEFSSLFE